MIVSVRPKARELTAAGCAGGAARVRSRRGTPALAGAGSRDDVRVSGGRCAAGQVPRARSGRSRGPVGAARQAVHPCLRGPGGVAGGQHLQEGGRRADAGRVADGRPDLRASDIEAERAAGDRLEGLRRLGIDEISVRKGQRYITVVVDHDTGRLVWAHPGQDSKTVEKFLDLLGKERCEQIELVSCDMAEWIAMPVAERCPNAIRCVDPFHVVAARDRRAR